jgi:DNA repair protein RadC
MSDTDEKMAREDMPKYKVELRGMNSLSDAEVLSMIIRSGSRDEDVLVSREVLRAAEYNLHELSKLSLGDLRKVKGISEANSRAIVAALELGRRRQIGGAFERKKIGKSSDIFDLMEPAIGHLDHEEFWAIYLNRANLIINKTLISIGALAGTVVNTQMVFRLAIEKKASAVICCHNHPSGNTQPSEADKRLTTKLKEGLSLMDSPLLDHIIICEDKFYSFADEGNL